MESLTFALAFDLNERQKQGSEEGKRGSGICRSLFLKSALAYNRQIDGFPPPPSEIPFNPCKTAAVAGEGLNRGPTPVPGFGAFRAAQPELGQ